MFIRRVACSLLTAWFGLLVLSTFVVPATAQSASRGVPAYVGTSQCASCHAREHDAWRGSHHDRAMEEADERSVLGDFANARFTYAGVTTRFFRRDGRHFVRTDGPDGKLAEFAIKYTFGVYPLQQYLVALPGGRFQAFGIAWDERPTTSGGQRWYHLYPDQTLKPGDPLHWTGHRPELELPVRGVPLDQPAQGLRRGDAAPTHDVVGDRRRLRGLPRSGLGRTWPGPDSLAEVRRTDATKGLIVALDERRGATWSIDPASGSAALVAAHHEPRDRDLRPLPLAQGAVRRRLASRPAACQRVRVATLDPGLYHPDGQQREEVYTHGSFLQSRMHAKGVTCSDCHDPHTQKLRAPGNAVCGQCHAPSRFDVASHHHHRPGTPGAQCASCHMPTTTYMIVDPRHDHSMRIPRPDRSAALGTPDACGGCHAKQGPKWAAEAVARWFPQRRPGAQSFAEAFAAAERGGPGSRDALLAVVADPSHAGLVRASALVRLGGAPGRAGAAALLKALEDGDAVMRETAARQLRTADPALRLRVLPRLLGDPERSVRMEAARSLAGAPERRLAEADRPRFDVALAEYEAALRFTADRPESHRSSVPCTSYEDGPTPRWRPSAPRCGSIPRSRPRRSTSRISIAAAAWRRRPRPRCWPP